MAESLSLVWKVIVILVRLFVKNVGKVIECSVIVVLGHCSEVSGMLSSLSSKRESAEDRSVFGNEPTEVWSRSGNSVVDRDLGIRNCRHLLDLSLNLSLANSWVGGGVDLLLLFNNLLLIKATNPSKQIVLR